MVIKTPKRHYFPHNLTAEISDATGHTVPVWEISVPHKDDVAWSIVLSYLLLPNSKDKQKDFQDRLNVITGSERDLKSIRKTIEFFNPFRNRYACFYDDRLKQIIRQFKELLNWSALNTLSDKLLASANLLNCQILLLEKTGCREKFQIYPTKNNKSQIMITLRSSFLAVDEDVQISSKVYNFMLSKKFGYKLRSCALNYYLREAEIAQKFIRKITAECQEENLLISILKSSFRKVLLDIYKSPYIVSRLAEAGYHVDPRSKDSEGMSALYHALKCEDSKVLYQLYYFAANSCCESEGSFRNPDFHIVSNLVELESTLLTDLSKSDNFQRCQNRDKIQKSFNDLLTLNKFLVEINRRVLNINSKLNYYELVPDNIFEACKRRDIIVTVINTYKEFFMREKEGNFSVSLLEDFVQHRKYYTSVDIISAVHFFDNIVYLKERLSLENESLFSEMESCFYFSIIFSVAFDETDISKLFKSNFPMSDLNSFYWFQLMQRMDTYAKMTKFRDILQNINIVQENMVENIPEDEIYSILKSYPELKDLLQVTRLKYYLKTVSNVKVIDLKSVMVIQRALQVIGEYITPETDEDFSVRRFMLLYLPKETTHILHRIRHEMSHLKGHAFPNKFEFEKNFPALKSIQKEIFYIRKYLRPVFHIQTLIATVFMLEKFVISLDEMKATSDIYSYNFEDPFFARDDVFYFLREVLPPIFFLEFATSFSVVFERVLKNIEEEITVDQYWRNSSQSLVETVKGTLWPLKNLLELRHRCKQYNFTPLLEDLRSLEENSSLTNVKENTIHFLEKCKKHASSFSKPPSVNSRDVKAVENSKIFLKMLRGFTYLSEIEKNKIRNEIPPTIHESIAAKETLIQTIENGFSLSRDELEEYEMKLIYLSRSKLQKLHKYYMSKNLDALEILKTPDPITELEEAVSKSHLDETKHKPLCDIMQFSEESRKKLWKLVAGQKKKIAANNLSNLLNRIQVMKKILIEDNKEILELWTKTKSEKARLHVFSKIVQLYLRDHQLHAAVEMLLFDCMVIFESEKALEGSWIKSAKLYRGLNLRNVIGHGSPLLEHLCRVFDPEDLPAEIVRNAIRLIEGEDAVLACLELYQRLDFDFPRLQKVLNSRESGEFDDLRSRILKCNEGKSYSLLLPYRRQ